MSLIHAPARGNLRAALGAISLCALFAMTTSAPAQAKTLAKVNGVEITEDDLKLAAEDIAPSIPRQLEGKARESYVLDYLVDEQLLVQEAQAEKLAETPEFARRLAYLRDKALFESLLAKVAKEATTETNIKQTYDQVVKNQKPETEYHAHHILLPSEDEAKAVAKRIKGGEDFAKVAGETSKDPGAQGGDLGWFTKDKMVTEFAEAVAKMEPGQISDPVKSQFGWHIIRLDEKRPKVFPPLDQIRPQVERYVAQKATAEFVTKLRESAKIERSDAAASPPEAKDAAKPADKKK